MAADISSSTRCGVESVHGRIPTSPTSVGRVEGYVLVAMVVGAVTWTGLRTHDIKTWLAEVFWILLGLPLILLLWKKFPLSRLLCWLLAFHALVLCYGGQYTYAGTPIGEWFQHLFGTQRNNYDRFAHVVQGFVPAILVREILLRKLPVRPGGWLVVLTTSICLAFAAIFELLEWGAAVIVGSGADAFLAAQGDVWDTQWDMFLCLVGALVAQLLLSRLHNRQLDISRGETHAV